MLIAGTVLAPPEQVGPRYGFQAGRDGGPRGDMEKSTERGLTSDHERLAE